MQSEELLFHWAKPPSPNLHSSFLHYLLPVLRTPMRISHMLAKCSPVELYPHAICHFLICKGRVLQSCLSQIWSCNLSAQPLWAANQVQPVFSLEEGSFVPVEPTKESSWVPLSVIPYEANRLLTERPKAPSQLLRHPSHPSDNNVWLRLLHSFDHVIWDHENSSVWHSLPVPFLFVRKMRGQHFTYDSLVTDLLNVCKTKRLPIKVEKQHRDKNVG